MKINTTNVCSAPDFFPHDSVNSRNHKEIDHFSSVLGHFQGPYQIQVSFSPCNASLIT